jgi:uncharacterized membrane protein
MFEHDLFGKPASTFPDHARAPEPSSGHGVISRNGGTTMQTFVGMILGALLLGCGVYVYDSMQTSSVANGQVAQASRTIVNWDVAAADWARLKTRAHDDWVKISSK